jgi:hypothetical protein
MKYQIIVKKKNGKGVIEELDIGIGGEYKSYDISKLLNKAIELNKKKT